VQPDRNAGISGRQVIRVLDRTGRSPGIAELPRVKALMSLAAGPLSLADLAQAIETDASYTTIIVNELQALGLLSRTPDARDRRRKTVELTAGGQAAMAKARDIIHRPPSPLRGLPAADLLRLREILGQLSHPQVVE